MLTIRLLGAVDIKLDNNQHADLGSRKAIALLIYLVMEGKPVARDTVTALLWPEMAEAAAKNNLRTTLTRLKRHLGSYLEITPARVAFNYHLPHIVDVTILQSRLAAALSGQDLQELQQAIDLEQGEFLQGFHYNCYA